MIRKIKHVHTYIDILYVAFNKLEVTIDSCIPESNKKNNKFYKSYYSFLKSSSYIIIVYFEKNEANRMGMKTSLLFSTLVPNKFTY